MVKTLLQAEPSQYILAGPLPECARASAPVRRSLRACACACECVRVRACVNARACVLGKSHRGVFWLKRNLGMVKIHQ